MEHITVARLVAPWLMGSPIDAIRMSVANRTLRREIDLSRSQFRTGALETFATQYSSKNFDKPLMWSPCGRYLVGIMTYGCITVWSTETHRILRHLVNDRSTPATLDSVSAECITTMANERVSTWSLPSFQPSETDYSDPDPHTFVSVSRGMRVRRHFDTFDITRLATNETYRLEARTSGQTSNCAFTHDTTKMVSTLWKNGPYLQVFDLNAARRSNGGNLVAKMGSPGEEFDQEYILANRSNRAIISNQMAEPCIVNFDTGAISIDMFSHVEFRDYKTCAWSRDDLLIAVAIRKSEKCDIYIVSTATRGIIHCITTTGPINVERMCFSPDSRRLAVMTRKWAPPGPETMQLNVIDARSDTVSFE